MTKQVTITLSDHVVESYLSEPTNNRSREIERLIILGAESLLGEETTKKAKLMKLLQERNDLQTENKKLKLELGKYKKKFSDHDPEREANERITDGILANNPLRDL